MIYVLGRATRDPFHNPHNTQSLHEKFPKTIIISRASSSSDSLWRARPIAVNA